MKKKLFILIMVVLAAGLLAVTGCGGSTDEGNADNEGTSVKIDATIVGGSIGGAWATIGEGVCEVVRREYAGSDMRYETGEEAANVALVS